MKTVYITNDGQKFSTQESAIAHEKDLEDAKKKAEQKDAEREAEAKKVLEAYDTYCELRDKYYKKYPETCDWVTDLFNTFF